LESEGFGADSIWTTRSADIRYRGQAYELQIDMPAHLDSQAAALIADRFQVEHQQRYGHMDADQAIELVNLRVQVWGRVSKPEFRKLPDASGELEIGRRRVWLDGSPSAVVPVYDRNELPPAGRLEGPAVLVQLDCTTLLLDRDVAETDDFGNLVITVGSR
jgi:N-methylhydantoinase A